MISIINCQKTHFIKAFATITLIMLLSFSVNAQEIDKAGLIQEPDLKQEFEQSFQQMLKDPSNVDITLKYARTAVSLGNYEAAIPPLERILIFNPDLPKIKLELGVLYYKLDSMKMAKSYFEGAINSKDVSDEIRSSASDYLQKIKG